MAPSQSGAPCCPPGTIWDEVREICVPGHIDIFAPLKPLPPVLVSKSNTAIKVKSPVWATNITRPIDVMEWERQEIGPDEERLFGEWESAAGEYEDTHVAPLRSYHYRCRAIGPGGTSLWSDYLTVTLISSTAHVVITEPEDGATITGERVWLQMTITDTGAGATEQKFQASGFDLPTSPTRLPGGTNKNGQWRLLFDTTEWLVGEVPIRGLALGSDGLFAFDEVVVNVENTPSTGIDVADWGPLVSGDALVFDKVHVSAEVPVLSDRPRRQWWATVGLRAWLRGESDPLPTRPTDAEEVEEQRLKHQAVTMGAGPVAESNSQRPERRLFRATPRLLKGAHYVVARVVLTRREIATAQKLAPSSKLYKAREAGDKTLIYGLDSASVWEFDGDLAVIKWNGEEASRADAVDFALLDDKVLVVMPDNKLWLLDTDANDLPARIILARIDGTEEDRPIKFIEAVGGAFWVWCVDPNKVDATKTVVYKITGNQFKKLFEMQGAVSGVDVSNSLGIVGMSVGSQLWRSNTGAAPVLAREFPSPISAFSGSLVGLQNGEVWNFLEDYFLEGTILSGPVGAVGTWMDGGETARAVAIGEGDLQMWERGFNNSPGFGPARVLSNPTQTPDTVENVRAFRRFVQTVEIPEEEQTGAPGEATTRDIDKLLALTEDDGLLIVLYTSSLSESTGSFLCSQLPTLTLGAGGAKKPLPPPSG